MTRRESAFQWGLAVVFGLAFAILYDLAGDHLTRHQLWLAGTFLGFIAGAVFDGLRS